MCVNLFYAKKSKDEQKHTAIITLYKFNLYVQHKINPSKNSIQAHKKHIQV